MTQQTYNRDEPLKLADGTEVSTDVLKLMNDRQITALVNKAEKQAGSVHDKARTAFEGVVVTQVKETVEEALAGDLASIEEALDPEALEDYTLLVRFGGGRVKSSDLVQSGRVVLKTRVLGPRTEEQKAATAAKKAKGKK